MGNANERELHAYNLQRQANQNQYRLNVTREGYRHAERAYSLQTERATAAITATAQACAIMGQTHPSQYGRMLQINCQQMSRPTQRQAIGYRSTSSSDEED